MKLQQDELRVKFEAIRAAVASSSSDQPPPLRRKLLPSVQNGEGEEMQHSQAQSFAALAEFSSSQSLLTGTMEVQSATRDYTAHFLGM